MNAYNKFPLLVAPPPWTCKTRVLLDTPYWRVDVTNKTGKSSRPDDCVEPIVQAINRLTLNERAEIMLRIRL